MAHVLKKPRKPEETLIDRHKKFINLNKNAPEQLWKNTGFQVVMSAHNANEWLTRALESVERSMSGLNWVFLLANDGSTDETQDRIDHNKKYCSADVFESHYFSKAESAAQAKNRIIKEINHYRKDYPAILLCDADDEVHDGKARGLISFAKKHNKKFVVGDYTIEAETPKEWIRTTHQAKKNVMNKRFGPWATLMHESLIPEDGKLFHEGLMAHEDLLLWEEMHKAGIFACPANGVETYTYFRRKGSLSFNEDPGVRDKLWAEYKLLSKEVYKL